MISANAKDLNTSPPKKNKTLTTNNVVNDVITVLLKVSFKLFSKLGLCNIETDL